MNQKTQSFFLALLLSSGGFAASPQFYLPLDGSSDVVGTDGNSHFPALVSGKARYGNGVNGRALEICRYAYDQATTLQLNRLPIMDWGEGTISFFFKPNWNADASGSRWLMYGFKGKDFRFYFLKTLKGELEFSFCAPDQRQVIVKNPLKAEKWVHLAVAWSLPKGEVAIYIDGHLAGKRVEEKWKKAASPLKISPEIWLGRPTADRFKAEVGEGFYDDLRIYSSRLSDEEILAESIGGRKQKMTPLPLSAVREKNGRQEIVLRCREKRFSAPRALMVFYNGKNSLTLTAMGVSGKLALRADKTVLESPYVLDLSRPLKLALEPSSTGVRVFFDDAPQGVLELQEPWGKLSKLEVADGVKTEAADAVPSPSDIVLLSTKSASPLERELWKLNDAERRMHGGVRESICLNGVWRLFRAEHYSYAPLREKDQLYSRVPGSPRSRHFHHYREKKGKLEVAKKSSRIDTAGWYQRTFTIPDEWKGKRIWLNFTNLHGDYGRVYLNGRLIDSFLQDFKLFSYIPNPRRMEVTELIQNENVLTVFIDRFIISQWQGAPNRGDSHGVALEDVWLESSPSSVSLRNAIDFPSLREKRLEMRARIRNPRGFKGRASVEFRYRMEGKADTVFTRHFTLTGDADQRIVFQETWRNPILWDCEHPNLYTRSVTLFINGIKADALPDSQFGFREFRVENGEFRLNGKKTRLRMWSNSPLQRYSVYYPDDAAMAAFVSSIREMNYDTVRVNPFTKESCRAYFSYLRESDRQGLYNLFPMPPYEGEKIPFYRKWVERFLDAYGNHPSILMWYTDFNTCHYPWCQDPAKLNDTAYVPQNRVTARRLAQTAESVMRSMDPSRELFQHAGGNSGKIFTSMNYQSMGTPLQEQEDWPRQWSEKHTQPLMVVESNFPFQRQFEYFDGETGRIMAAEHAARFFGDSVFRKEIRPVPYLKDGIFSPYAQRNANFNAVCELMYRNVVRAWRAYDLSALGDFQHGYDLYYAFRGYGSLYNHRGIGIIDNRVKNAGVRPDRIGYVDQMFDHSRPEGLYHAMRDAFRPLKVFLGGRTDDFTSKDHAFFSGERFEKSIVIVNDRTTAQNLRFRWEFSVGGKTISSGTPETKIDAGGILKLPIRLTAPEVAERSEGVLKLEVYRDGFAESSDQLAIQIFPKHRPPEFRNISAGLYDPAGKTAAMLRKAGFPFRIVSTLEEAEKCQLLIIGQNALGDQVPEFLKQLESGEFIRRGCNILIFEQKACNLGNFVFESPSYRNAFIRRPDSLLVQGLKDEDFSNWRGKSDTVPAFVLSDENTPHYPRSKWKCGNGGIVAGNVIRKPTYGNFSTIVDCGFNLMFAALMELRMGHGQILFCQLDVTSRYGKDPVATRLVDNMLTVMGRPSRPLLPQRVAYLGDAKNEAILKRMGMEYDNLNGCVPSALRNYQVILLGKDPVPEKRKEAFRKEIRSQLQRAYVALPGAPLDLLPIPMKTVKKLVFRASLPKDDPVFSGIPEADLYLREARELPVLDNPPDWMVTTSPALFGRYDFRTGAQLIMTLSPDQVEEKFWLREKISRVWNAVFNNMNVGLGKDFRLFTSFKIRHNTKTPSLGVIVPEKAGLKLDPENRGSVNDSKGFVPVKLNLPWEEQGFQMFNPHHIYPPNVNEKLKNMYDGWAWYRIPVTIPENWKTGKILFKCSSIDDADITYFNGARIGETKLSADSYRIPRSYPIPSSLVKFGEENWIVIRVYDRWGKGGITGSLSIVAEDPKAENAWSPYLENLNFYDVDAFHNW